jgi:hypothetical protein
MRKVGGREGGREGGEEKGKGKTAETIGERRRSDLTASKRGIP